MATYERGIPDDTPENTLRSIREILKEEAQRLEASFTNGEIKDKNGVALELAVNIRSGAKWFRLFLRCIKSEHLAGYDGTIGEGFICWGSSGGPSDDRLTLEMFHGCPPYRWSVYPGTIEVGNTEPTDHLLDGTFLRATVREKLAFFCLSGCFS